MISAYIRHAMRHATYEFLPNDKVFYGEIALLPGVYATGDNVEDCRDELREVLEGYILYSFRMNLSLPEIDGLSLELKEAA